MINSPDIITNLQEILNEEEHVKLYCENATSKTQTEKLYKKNDQAPSVSRVKK